MARQDQYETVGEAFITSNTRDRHRRPELNGKFITGDASLATAIVLRLEEKGEVNRWPFIRLEERRWVFEWEDPEGDLHWWQKEYQAGKIGTDDLRRAFKVERQLLDEARDLRNGKKE